MSCSVMFPVVIVQHWPVVELGILSLRRVTVKHAKQLRAARNKVLFGMTGTGKVQSPC